MNNNQYYSTIFHRKSIRKIVMAPLPAEILDGLQDFTKSLKPLDENIKVDFAYLETPEVRNLLPNRAPHYICLYSEKKGNYLMNAGFLLQQIDLYLSANDIGSCWLGIAKPTKQELEKKNGLEFVIMIAFGKPDEPVHRASPTEFNRKALSAICTIAGAETLLEPVRLAPSASNTQCWFFSGTLDEIIVSREKLNIIRTPLYDKINQIDIGIALCHLWISLEQEGRSMSLDFQTAVAPDGYEFMAKVITAEK